MSHQAIGPMVHVAVSTSVAILSSTAALPKLVDQKGSEDGVQGTAAAQSCQTAKQQEELCNLL